MATRILHTSVPARDPERAARILAELTGGAASRFRAKGMAEGAWVCIWNEVENELVEFVPYGYVMVPGSAGAEFRLIDRPLGYNATHVQLLIDIPITKIKAAADANDCRHYFRPASGGPLYEVWLEEQLLVELVSTEIRGLLSRE